MKKIIIITSYILLLFSISSLFSKELALKKISETAIKEQEAYFKSILKDTILVPMLNGMLKVGDVSLKTSAPFVLNNNVSWEFKFKLTHVKGYQLVNDNLFLMWYRKNENNRWVKINTGSWQFSQKGETEFLIKFEKENIKFHIENPLQVNPYCGFAVPLYLQKTENPGIQIAVKDYFGSNKVKILLTNIDSTLLNKKLVLKLSTENGSIYYIIEKVLNVNEQLIETGIKKIISGENNFSLNITGYSSNKKIFQKEFMINKRSYKYDSPMFKMNDNPVQFNSVKFIPDFNYISFYFDPLIQKNIFSKLKSEGYNSIILSSIYVNPVLLKNAGENGLAIVIKDVDNVIYENFVKKGWVGQNLIAGYIWKEGQSPTSELLKGIHFKIANLINDSIPGIQNENLAPYYKMSYYSTEFLTKLSELYKSKGGLLINTGFHYNKCDSVISHEVFFKKAINKCKLISSIPISTNMFNLTSSNTVYPFSFANNSNDEFHILPNYLIGADGFKERESKEFISFAKSPVPKPIEVKEFKKKNESLFILFGIINFFAFTFYFLRLKSFKLYFMRAVKNSHGFFMDLSEKIAVPWSETLFLAIFIGIGLTTTIGSFLSIFNKSLMSNNIINLILIKPELTKLLFKSLDKPFVLIIAGFTLFLLYLMLLTFSMRLSFFIFKKRIRLKNCWAISIWSHVLLAIYTIFGLIAYNSIILLHVSYEFWIFLAFVLLLSYFRLNRGIFITSGLKFYQIYLMSFLFIGTIIGIFYFANYPFAETYQSIKMLMELYH